MIEPPENGAGREAFIKKIIDLRVLHFRKHF
jgi:hypothetical protein